MKWRVQFEKASSVDQEIYYYEIDANALAGSDMSDITKQLSKAGFINAQYGLVVVIP